MRRRGPTVTELDRVGSPSNRYCLLAVPEKSPSTPACCIPGQLDMHLGTNRPGEGFAEDKSRRAVWHPKHVMSC